MSLSLKKTFSLRNVSVFSVCVLMLIFILYSDIYLQSVKNGLNLYVTAVLPSMLPFFFFSKLLTELNFASDVGKLLKKPLSLVYASPPIGGYILFMSFLCGYPVGAKLISECYDRQLLTQKDAEKIASFSSTAGPLFIVGTVGVTMFANKNYGFILLLCHYIGTLLNGLIYRGKKRDVPVSPVLPSVSSDDILNKSMLNTFLSIGLVGGYITVFNLLSDVFFETGIFSFLSSSLEFIGINNRLSTGFFAGIIEMTRGCLLLSSSGFSPRLVLPLCEFLITFGGLGVTFQSLTFLSKTKISPGYYFLTKFTQGIICSSLCFLVCLSL